jgi:hypothetical protein
LTPPKAHPSFSRSDRPIVFGTLADGMAWFDTLYLQACRAINARNLSDAIREGAIGTDDVDATIDIVVSLFEAAIGTAREAFRAKLTEAFSRLQAPDRRS